MRRFFFFALEIMTGDFFAVINFPVDRSCFWDFSRHVLDSPYLHLPTNKQQQQQLYFDSQ